MDPEYIENQLARLPEKIDKFTRRFAGFDDRLHIQYTTHGFWGVVGKQEITNDVLIMKSGTVLSDLVDQVIYDIKLLKIVEDEHAISEPLVYIAQDLIDQGLTVMSVIRPAGLATMLAPCLRFPVSYFEIFFMVSARGYLLTFGRRGDHYFFVRNNKIVHLRLPPLEILQLIDNMMAIAITWSLEDISISGHIESLEKKDLKSKWVANSSDRKTAPTVPPNELYTWARQQLLLSNRAYNRPGEVFNVITNALRYINEEITVTNDIAAFWDEQRQEKKSTDPVPKREPVITRHIESRLRDITLQKNIDIMREVELGNSKLDLLFSGPLNDNSNVKVCVEVKKAHADRLVDGLTTQLPEYMRKVGTDYGIYCVIYFGARYPHKIKPFEQVLGSTMSIDLKEHSLETLLNLLTVKLPYKNLLTLVIDVSHRATASKL